MRSMCWWQFGLFGGVVLTLATFVKAVGTVLTGSLKDADWGQAVGFAVFIFGMGFLSGLIVWAGRGLYRYIGLVGDALVGLAVMLVFFLSCMLRFAPEMLGRHFLSGGLPMFGLATVVGLIGGAWIGRDIRMEHSKRQ